MTFLLMTYIEKTSYFEVAPPVHTTAYKNTDNLFENDKFYILILIVIQLNSRMFKKCSKFHNLTKVRPNLRYCIEDLITPNYQSCSYIYIGQSNCDLNSATFRF